ncbi:MAG: hypothetical protein DMF67_19835 [Acidobacteria bacterium]|nr:MAG: hypothetical protein DMF66_08700 [Acidobacteriota bacterium]PYS80597.1 MAG: hypothetical protein DMF67_19835 [Acidobacteriota bacterium]
MGDNLPILNCGYGGGTFDHDDWPLAPRPEQAARILAGHTEIMKCLKGEKILSAVATENSDLIDRC